MSTYVVTTPNNPEFAGKVYGIQFSNGKAVLSKETISPHLGLTVDYIAKALKTDFGYTVTPIVTDQPAETGQPPAQGAEVAKKTRKG